MRFGHSQSLNSWTDVCKLSVELREKGKSTRLTRTIGNYRPAEGFHTPLRLRSDSLDLERGRKRRKVERRPKEIGSGRWNGNHRTKEKNASSKNWEESNTDF